MIVHDRVRETVLASDKSYVEIGKALGVTNQAVAAWVNKGKCPYITRLGDFCRYFGVSADWLLGLSDRRERQIER